MMEGVKTHKESSGKERASQGRDCGKFGTVEEASGEVLYTMPHNENIHRTDMSVTGGRVFNILQV
jgi:hypothetical protein